MIRHSWLAMLAAGLVLLLAAEWLLPDHAGAPMRPPPAIPAAAQDASADTHVAEWGNMIMVRPVFRPDRRPVRQPVIAAIDTLPRLSAIIVIAGARSAIFDTAGQKPLQVTEGGEIGGYRLKTVAADSVDLLGPNGPVMLRPQFISAAPPAP